MARLKPGAEAGLLAVVAFFVVVVPFLGFLLALFGTWDRHEADRPLARAAFLALAVVALALALLPDDARRFG